MRTVECQWNHDGVDMLVVCRVTPGHPGQLSGPPEKCWPPEPAEVEVISVAEELTGESRPDLIREAEGDDVLCDAAVEAAGDEP
jgi:hypothetical protein